MLSFLAYNWSVVVAVVALAPFVSGCADPASIRASVDEVTSSPESIPYARVHMRFVNASERTLRVTQYRVLWPGGSKVLEPDELVIAPRAEQQRSAKVSYDDGDPRVLLQKPGEVRVEVVEVSRF